MVHGFTNQFGRDNLSNIVNYGADATAFMPTLNGRRATLYLYKPRTLHQQNIRSLTYAFTDDFAERTARVINDDKNTSGINAKLTNLVTNSDSISSIVKPTTTGSALINLNHMSHLWSFLFIVDNETPMNTFDSTDMNSGPSAKLSMLYNNRVYYCGFVLDDPGFPERNIYNDNARLMITHKTVVGQAASFGPSGQNAMIDVQASNDYVPGVLGSITSTELSSNKPESIFKTVTLESDGDDNLTAMSLFNSNERVDKNKQVCFHVPDALTVPSSNVGTIVKAISRGVDFVRGESFAGTLSHDRMAARNIGPGYGEMLQEHLHQTLAIPDTSGYIGLKPESVITFGILKEHYHPQVDVYDIGATGLFSVLDQRQNNARNMLSSFIATVGTSIMTSFGLAQLSFTYDSSIPFGEGVHFHITTGMVPYSDHEKLERCRAVIKRFEREIFSICLKNRGDFHLVANLNVGNFSRVILNFYCDDERIDTPYEVPTIAGGMLSNQTAPLAVVSHNGASMGAFIDRVSKVNNNEVLLEAGAYVSSAFNNRSLLDDRIPEPPRGGGISSLISNMNNDTSSAW